MAQKQQDMQNTNTLANEAKVVRCFQSFLESAGQDKDFFNYTEPELDKWLAKFYFSARTVTGEMYKAGSLNT